MKEERIDTVASVFRWRFLTAGALFVLGPRWLRGFMADMTKLSDNQMRTIGYALLGASGLLALQQATKRSIGARLDALAQQRPVEAG